MTVSGTNFGRAAAEYGADRAGFPESIFNRLGAFGIGKAGQRVVDLGTGTGTLARGFAQRGCKVTCVDPDERMIEQAKAIDRQSGVEITYATATAESTGLKPGIADAITAGQCWHWFDRKAALREVSRISKPRGHLVIAHFDWLPLANNVVAATEKLIEQYNPDWDLGGGNGMYPQWVPDLTDAGMAGIESFFYDVNVPYTPEAWRRRIQASAGIAALDTQTASDFDDNLTELLTEAYPQEILDVPHRIYTIIAEVPSSGS